jgi:type IV secretory pathway ATPase VirB11/archaellum biosynthesis ATPase
LLQAAYASPASTSLRLALNVSFPRGTRIDVVPRGTFQDNAHVVHNHLRSSVTSIAEFTDKLRSTSQRVQFVQCEAKIAGDGQVRRQNDYDATIYKLKARPWSCIYVALALYYIQLFITIL